MPFVKQTSFFPMRQPLPDCPHPALTVLSTQVGRVLRSEKGVVLGQEMAWGGKKGKKYAQKVVRTQRKG